MVNFYKRISGIDALHYSIKESKLILNFSSIKEAEVDQENLQYNSLCQIYSTSSLDEDCVLFDVFCVDNNNKIVTSILVQALKELGKIAEKTNSVICIPIAEIEKVNITDKMLNSILNDVIDFFGSKVYYYA